MSSDRSSGPLAGTTVAITADRRGAELAASLERIGAVVVWGSTMTAVPPEQDSLLEVESRAVLAADPSWLAVSTGSGLRAWLQAAEGFGLREDIEALLRRTRTVARGSKSHGALRAMRIEPEFVSPKETMDDICSWLVDRLGPDDVLAAQVHGGEVIGTLDALRPRVRDVLTIAPYRWVLPADVAPARAVVEQLLVGQVDVLAETSAPSVRNLFVVADGMGCRNELVRTLKGTIAIACVGAVTARAFEEVGIAVDVKPNPPTNTRPTMNDSSTPRFLQGVYPIEGAGLEAPFLLDPAMAYTVPPGSSAQPVYFRGGNSSDEMIYVTLVRDGTPMRYFPIGAKGSTHVSLRVVEDLLSDTVLEIFVAAPEATAVTVVVDLGLVEI